MEIGSFIELEYPKGKELYKGMKNIARLNTGRAAIWHALRIIGKKSIWVPFYQCETVREFLQMKNIAIKYYHIDKDFNPIDLNPSEEEAVLLVNYFGIMSRPRMTSLASKYNNVIIDNCQAFFSSPINGVLNVYSARKFLGVPDGAYVLGENAHLFVNEYLQGYSSDTAVFLLMRIEYGCSGKGYEARMLNENRIDTEDIMKMSNLTFTLLDGADYDNNKNKRIENFHIACELFNDINQLNPLKYFDVATVPMVYPLVVEDESLLNRLIEAKHFQGHWWMYITNELYENTFEYWLSKYVIPITIDQRYGRKELEYIYSIVKQR